MRRRYEPPIAAASGVSLRLCSVDQVIIGREQELAATGMTNREVASAAFMSPKTVEANLARVYRKLGIASRAELGARMADEHRQVESQT